MLLLVVIPQTNNHSNLRDDVNILSTIASVCPRLMELSLDGYAQYVPSAPLAHVTRLAIANSHLGAEVGPLSVTFPQLAALRRHGGLECTGWIEAAEGHPTLPTLEVDFLDFPSYAYDIDGSDAVRDYARGWLGLVGDLPALSNVTLAFESRLWRVEFEELGGAGVCLPSVLSHLQGAAQLTRLDLTARLGLPLSYILACLGQYLGGRLPSLRVAGGEVPEASASVQLLALPAALPELADLTLAVPPVEARVMALLQPLGGLLPQCPSLTTLRFEAGELDTGSAGLERVCAHCAALSACGACKVFVA